jgi:hypothetical protein
VAGRTATTLKWEQNIQYWYKRETIKVAFLGWKETNPSNIREHPYTDIRINAVSVVP